MMNANKLYSLLLLTFSLAGSLSLDLGLFLPAPAVARTAEETTSNRVYTRANPAVVTVRVNGGHGSGFIISGNYVVTNAHVVKGQPAVVTVIMADGKTEIPVDVVGFATGGVDLALLKINRPGKFPTLALGNVKSLKVGDSVYAIGTPLRAKVGNFPGRLIFSSARSTPPVANPMTSTGISVLPSAIMTVTTAG